MAKFSAKVNALMSEKNIRKSNEKKTKFGETSIINEKITKICLKCNEKYDDSYNFCIKCGGELTNISDVENTIDKFKNEIIDSIKIDIQEKFSNDYLIFNTFNVIKKSSYEIIEKTHIKNKHGAGTKVLATMVGGPLGFVATTGIKEETSSEKIKKDGKYLHIKTKINEKHFIYQTYIDNKLSASFNDYKTTNKEIIYWKDIDYIDEDYFLILKTGESLKCPVFYDELLIHKNIREIIDDEVLHENFIKKHYYSVENIIKKYYLELLNEYAKNSGDEYNTQLDLNELERVAKLYEKGLLTDEEFMAAKRKLLDL